MKCMWGTKHDVVKIYLDMRVKTGMSNFTVIQRQLLQITLKQPVFPSAAVNQSTVRLKGNFLFL